MGQNTLKELLKASDVIDRELDKLSDLHGGGEFIISSAIGAKILGISHQAMEDRIKNGAIQVHDSFGRKYLLGSIIRDEFDTRILSLRSSFESLNKYESSQVKKIIDYAMSLEQGKANIPKRPS